MPARTVLSRNQPQVTRHLLPALKTIHVSHRQHKGHRGDRPHPRLGHQPVNFSEIYPCASSRTLRRLRPLFHSEHHGMSYWIARGHKLQAICAARKRLGTQVEDVASRRAQSTVEAKVAVRICIADCLWGP